jgi:hypothetical protein
MRKTRSDELLRDFEAMRFLARVDGALHARGAPLSNEDICRLEALYEQACYDGSEALQDILEHLESVANATRWQQRDAGPSGSSSCLAQVIAPLAIAGVDENC